MYTVYLHCAQPHLTANQEIFLPKVLCQKYCTYIVHIITWSCSTHLVGLGHYSDTTANFANWFQVEVFNAALFNTTHLVGLGHKTVAHCNSTTLPHSRFLMLS